MAHLVEDLMDIVTEIRSLHLDSLAIKSLESLCIYLQDSLPCEVFSFSILVIANLLFNAKLIVVSFDDVLVRGKTSEDWYFIHLKFLEPHEEIIDMTVLALHHDF